MVYSLDHWQFLVFLCPKYASMGIGLFFFAGDMAEGETGTDKSVVDWEAIHEVCMPHCLKPQHARGQTPGMQSSTVLQ